MVSHSYAGFNKKTKQRMKHVRVCYALWKVTLNVVFLGCRFQWDIFHTAAPECLTPSPLSPFLKSCTQSLPLVPPAPTSLAIFNE